MKLLLTLATFLLTFAVFAEELPLTNFQIKGWGFVRHESKKDADYDSDSKDKTETTQTRINVSVKADLADNYGYVFLAPQFTKISGADEFLGSSTTDNTATGTSGNLYDSRLDMHEAYFAVKPTHDDNLFIFAGRQELPYGDHLILGSVPWHRIGRSFDGVKGRYTISPNFNLDAFTMTLKENNATAPASSVSDTRLVGAYITGSLGSSIKAIDLYLLKKENNQSATSDFSDTNAYGVRLKSKIGETAFDYRAEGTLQQNRMAVDNAMEEGEYQYDLEFGYTIPYKETRIAFEYFDSTKNYDQLYPTAHKFLGYADQFARRNINGYVAHVMTKPVDKFTLNFDYHVFKRHDDKSGAYNFSGSSLGTSGDSKDVANELDMVLTYDFSKTLQISYGYCLVNSGKYFEDQNADKKDTTHFSYLQLLARF